MAFFDLLKTTVPKERTFYFNPVAGHYLSRNILHALYFTVYEPNHLLSLFNSAFLKTSINLGTCQMLPKQVQD